MPGWCFERGCTAWGCSILKNNEILGRPFYSLICLFDCCGDWNSVLVLAVVRVESGRQSALIWAFARLSGKKRHAFRRLNTEL